MKNFKSHLNLYVLRHADAGEPDSREYPDDSLRPLSEKGKREAKQVGKLLEKLEVKLSLILTSPYTRTLQTAAIVQEILDPKIPLEKTRDLIPSGDPASFTRQLLKEHSSTNLLIVGHEPFLSQWFRHLIKPSTHFHFEPKKASLTKLRHTPPSHFHLKWHIPPKLTLA